MRQFKYSDNKSHKFWNIEQSGKSYTVEYGRVGSKGQSKTKDYGSEAEATKAYEKIIAEKVKEGYVETTPTSAPPSTKQMLEKAILDDPENLAAHTAYADWLTALQGVTGYSKAWINNVKVTDGVYTVDATLTVNGKAISSPDRSYMPKSEGK